MKLSKLLIMFLTLGLLLAGCGGVQGGGSSPADIPEKPPATSQSPEAAPLPREPAGTDMGEAAEPAEDTDTGKVPEAEKDAETEKDPEEGDAEMKLRVQVGDRAFLATLEDNAAVDALVEMMREAPVVVQMRDYSGFEKVGSLGADLPASDRQTTTQAGDIVLYTGNQIVMFYGSNSWSYTRLGRIDDLTGWKEALGSGGVTVSFSLG